MEVRGGESGVMVSNVPGETVLRSSWLGALGIRHLKVKLDWVGAGGLFENLAT